MNTLEIRGSSVPDKIGSPLNVSAMITYKITNPLAAVYNVQNYQTYIKDQALEVLKRVCSRFPYDSKNSHEPSLMNDSSDIAIFLKELLNAKCKIAGAEILRMEIMEFSYHKEIAANMLLVQQAQSKIEARKLIVEGAVGIVKDAARKVDQCQIVLDRDIKEELIKNMLVVTCSDQGKPRLVLQFNEPEL